MIKKPITTQEQALRTQMSLQKMGLISRILIMENQTHIVDTDFKIPFINNFARRIGQDCQTIEQHLKKSGRLIIQVADESFYNEYSAALWSVIDALAGLPLDEITAVAEELQGKVTA